MAKFIEAFEVALLRFKGSLTPDEACVLIGMQMFADTDNYLSLNEKEFRLAMNSLYTKRRFTNDIIKEAKISLKQKGLIPDVNRVLPMVGPISGYEATREEIDVAIEIAQNDGKKGIPDASHSHRRLAAALTACESLVAFQKSKKDYLREKNGSAILKDGRKVYYYRPTWDYALAASWIRDYTIDRLIDVIFGAWRSGINQKLPPDPKERQRALRGYYMKALQGNITTIDEPKTVKGGISF